MDKNTEKLNDIKHLVDLQAEDETLWVVTRTATEAYLQRKLRELHALIERED